MDKPVLIGIAAGMVKEFRHLPKGLLGLASHITFGSFTLNARQGNDEPNWWYDPVTGKMLNAIGLKNLGFRHFLTEELEAIYDSMQSSECELRVSLAPTEEGHLERMVNCIEPSHAAMIRVLEINAACPNHRTGNTHHPVLAHDGEALERLILESRAYKGIRALKIAPCTTRTMLERIVTLCMRHGIDRIVSGNTLLVDAVIDGKQVLSVPMCGMSGKPLYEHTLSQAIELCSIIDERNAKIELTLCGGITDTDGALDISPFGFDLSVATLFWNHGADAVADLITRANLAL